MIAEATSFTWMVLHPLRGDGYQFWSGIAGSFLTSLPGWFAAGAIFWRHHNCHVHRCPWISIKSPTAAGHYVCKKHHRKITGIENPSVMDLREAHLRGHD